MNEEKPTQNTVNPSIQIDQSKVIYVQTDIMKKSLDNTLSTPKIVKEDK